MNLFGIDIGKVFDDNAGIFMEGAGAGFKAFGASQDASNQKTMLQFQSQIDNTNAKVADYQASSALRKGQTDAGTVYLKGAQIKSDQKTSFAANGIDVNSASALDNYATTDYMAGRDAAMVKTNAQLQAWGFSQQAANLRDNALFTSSAANAINPTMSGIISLIGNAMPVAKSIYEKYKSTNKSTSAPAAYNGAVYPDFTVRK